MMLLLRSMCYMAFGIGLLVGVIPQIVRMADLTSGRFGGWGIGWLGPVAIMMGALIYFSCGLDFFRIGRGTPAFWEPPRTLVANPWFRGLRNPMYAGVGLMIVGQALWSGSILLLAYAALVMAGFHGFVVLYEEPHLRSVFGSEYEEYCNKVPRWIPRAAVRWRSAGWDNPKTG
jgi:protein-S-isoprenylcysteine O-methyltransferase Ste14